MPLTKHPPDRSVRAAFPHTAPTSDVKLAAQRCSLHGPVQYRDKFALSRSHDRLDHVLLGPAPSLQRLLGFRFVRRLQRYYETVRLLGSVHARRAGSLSRAGLISSIQTPPRPPGFRSESFHVRGSTTTPVPRHCSRTLVAPHRTRRYLHRPFRMPAHVRFEIVQFRALKCRNSRFQDFP